MKLIEIFVLILLFPLLKNSARIFQIHLILSVLKIFIMKKKFLGLKKCVHHSESRKLEFPFLDTLTEKFF